MRKRKDVKELAKRFAVKLYLPPESSMELARDRTEGMVHFFMSVSTGCDWLTAFEHLDTLIRSAYLQGVKDCAEVVAKRGLDGQRDSKQPEM